MVENNTDNTKDPVIEETVPEIFDRNKENRKTRKLRGQ